MEDLELSDLFIFSTLDGHLTRRFRAGRWGSNEMLNNISQAPEDPRLIQDVDCQALAEAMSQHAF